MKTTYLIGIGIVLCLGAAALRGQTVVINDPAVDTTGPDIDAVTKALVQHSALPKVRRKLASDICEEAFEPSGIAKGSFSKPRSKQTIVFYQFCQTGNGLGQVGLALIENGKVIGNFVANAGWSIGMKALPDINRNGRDEIALYYSGGMHQGMGGAGVDILELSGVGIRGLGWFQADSFGEDTGDYSYKVTVKPGKAPVFYREKYVSARSGKLRKAGKLAPFRLQKIVGPFTIVR